MESMCCQRCGEIRTLVHCGWEYKTVESSWKNTWFFKKIKNRIIIWSNYSTSGYTPKRTESRVSKSYLYFPVHSSITHNSPKVEATQVSINGWKDGQNVVYTCNGIFNLKKGKNSDTYYNMNQFSIISKIHQ